MSFPSGTIVLSAALPRDQQGTAASIINTVVNYSVSISLGIAGTVENHVNDSGNDLVRGYQGALYVAIGFSILGVLTSLAFIISTRFQHKNI